MSERQRLLLTTAAGVLIGGMFIGPSAARAQWPVIDVSAIVQAVKENGLLTELQSLQSAANTVLGSIHDALGATGAIASSLGNNAFGTVQDLLRDGATQQANYAKASVSAQQKIADASNTVMARNALDLRDAQIRDEHVATTAPCGNIDGGVATQAAAIQGWQVGRAIADVGDKRGEAGPDMPSYYGMAQGIAAMADAHKPYCEANDVDAGICTVSAKPGADQELSTLDGAATYPDVESVNAAKTYAVTLTEPVAPAALRGDQLASVNGQDAAVRRRSYNARMSVARTFVASVVGMHTPSIPLTATETQFLQDSGLPVPTSASWLQALQIEAQRRVSSVSWNTDLFSMPPASVQREIAHELALMTYLQFEQFKLSLSGTTISAATLAENTEHNFEPAVRTPIPTVVQN